MKNRISKSLLVVLFITTISPFINARAVDQRPNVIFIITDDQQTGLLGVEGSSVGHTPNIDRIGQEGVVFNNAFVVTPLCSPSRASFLTGQYAHKHNVINNDKLGLDVISHTLNTWPRQLRESGYDTAFIGKMHMGLDDSRRPGYDRWFSFKGQGAYIDPVVNDGGQRIQTTGNMTDLINEQALAYLREDHGNKPFAMVVAHKAVHWPILPTKRHEDTLPDFSYEVEPAKASDLQGKPLLTKSYVREPMYAIEGAVPEPQESRRNRGKSPTQIVGDEYRALMSVDDGVGQILEELEKNNQLDNTIIIYTSDNGMLMGDHGEFFKKRWAYDPVIRVPMLVRYPPLIKSGSRLEQMVLNIDIAPTIFELAGVDPLDKMHGLSLIPLLEKQNVSWRTEFLTEYFFEKVAVKYRPWFSVRTEDWKFIDYTESGIPSELYNLKADPKEETNVISDIKNKTVVKELRSKLQALLTATE